MPIEINTKVSSGAVDRGKKVGNLTLEDAKFFGRPNFRGEEDQFKDTRRKFTVLIPNEVADQLREMGWNVKTDIPTKADLEQWPDREPISHMKVMVDDNAFIQIRMGETIAPYRLDVQNYGAIDNTRIDTMDMEIRAWEYNPDEHPGKYSARLVTLIANVNMTPLEQKYGGVLG